MEMENAHVAAWIRHYAGGDRAAGEHLAEYVRSLLARRLRSLGVAPQDIEDVAQACALEVLRRMPDFDSSRGRLDSWITGFAKNGARMYNRAAEGRRAVESAIEEIPAAALQAEGAIQRESLALALDSLGVLDRELLFMRFSLELSSEEIAGSSDMTQGQVRKRISRAVERLRRHPALRELLQS